MAASGLGISLSSMLITSSTCCLFSATSTTPATARLLSHLHLLLSHLHLLHRLQPGDLHRVLLESFIRVLRNVRIVLGDVGVVRQICGSLDISQWDLVWIVGVEDVIETLGNHSLD